MPSAAPDNADRGFTLIEVLVALAIAALGLIAIFEGASAGMRSVDLAQRYVAATRFAQAHLAEVGAAIPLVDGDIGGADAGGYRWRVRIKPARARAAAGDASRGPVLYAVESVVSFSWGTTGAPRSVRLQSLRLSGPGGTRAALR
ncbi:MAG TPA: prepilin-type N-terminal cleavage/methylation domain-containing protein [Alphaproteobacteria bacterium]